MEEKLTNFFDSFVPLQLFRVKDAAKPKAQPWLLRLSTASVLLAGIAAFVALFLTQRLQYTTESSIELSDISDDEWTCSMASVITQSIALISTSEPNSYYNLMSINEQKQDCLKTLHGLDPCSHSSALLFSSGDVSTDQEFIIESASPAAASYHDTFYFSALAKRKNEYGGTISIQAYMYNVSAGKLTEGSLGLFNPFTYPANMSPYITSSTAMDTFGKGLFVAGDVYGYAIMHFDGVYAMTLNNVEEDSVLLTNDNRHVVFLLTSVNVGNLTFNHTLSRFKSAYEAPVTRSSRLYEIDTFQTVNTTILQFAVFSTLLPVNGTPALDTVWLYYTLVSYEAIQDSSQDLYFPGSIHVRNNGSSTLIRENITSLALQVSAWDNKVFVKLAILRRFGYINELITIDNTGIIHRFENSTILAGTSDAFALVLNETQYLYTSTAASYSMYQKDLTNHANRNPVRTGFAGSTVGWFVCDGALVTSALPPDIYSGCGINGFSWQLEYQDSYFSTEELFQQCAIAEAARQCNASLYDTICDRVGALPPYICSHKVYQPFFTVVATAIANAHILTVLLFMGAGYVLGKINKADRQQPKISVTDSVAMEMSPITGMQHDGAGTMAPSVGPAVPQEGP